MGVTPEKSSILMTEPVFNPESNRVKMAEILFEKYGFSRMQIGIQALLSLFAEVNFKKITEKISFHE